MATKAFTDSGGGRLELEFFTAKEMSGEALVTLAITDSSGVAGSLMAPDSRQLREIASALIQAADDLDREWNR